MSARLSPIPRWRFFDAAGVPLAGGKVYSYIAGTLTPKSTYTDQSGLTANTNPVELDANGEANVWLGSGAYKFVLKDALGIDQWTVDNVEAQPSNLDLNSLTVGTITVSGQISSTVTGVPPFIVASDSQVANLNASKLQGATWNAPAAIGSTTPAAGTFTDVSAGTSLKVGASGSVIKQIQKVSLTVNFPSIATVTRGSIAVAVPGVRSGDAISIVNGMNVLNDDLIFVGAEVTSNDVVTFYAYNPTGGSIDASAVSVEILWIDLT